MINFYLVLVGMLEKKMSAEIGTANASGRQSIIIADDSAVDQPSAKKGGCC